MANNQTRGIKVVIIGDSGVGKTSIRGQYISGRFSVGYRATIGTDFIAKTLPHHNKPGESVTLSIWDTAGQERFSSLSTAFFRGADAVVLMYDVNKPQTLKGLSKWWDSFKALAPVPDEEAEEYCCVLVGNKIDLRDHNSEGDGASEREANDFLEELIPRASSSGDSDRDDLEGLEGTEITFEDSQTNLNGHVKTSLPVPSSRPPPTPVVAASAPTSDSPTRTQSILINKAESIPSHPFAKHHKRVSKSRSSDRSHIMGTMTSRTSVYHTPSSSLFDNFESAPSSPIASSSSSLVGSEEISSPEAPSTRSRRMTSASSSSSAPTITPSLFLRTRASSSAVVTPPTPSDLDHDNNLRLPRTGLPPKPERRPMLFFTSAKTGDGVSPVFEYIAKRVTMREEYLQAIEDRTMHMRDGTSDTIRLSQSDTRSGLERLTGRVSSCCGT